MRKAERRYYHPGEAPRPVKLGGRRKKAKPARAERPVTAVDEFRLARADAKRQRRAARTRGQG